MAKSGISKRQMNVHHEIYFNVFSKTDNGELKSFRIRYLTQDSAWDMDIYDCLMGSRAYSLKDLLSLRADVFSRMFYSYISDIEGRKVDYREISPLSVLRENDKLFPLILDRID